MSDYKLLCKYKVQHWHIIITVHRVKFKRKQSMEKGGQDLTEQSIKLLKTKATYLSVRTLTFLQW